MVQNDETLNGNASNGASSSDESVTMSGTTRKIRPAHGITASDQYRLVGWSIDTTGRRLIDEIWQIAAFTPQHQFAQLVMPFTDLNSTFRRRHNMVVINKGKYRTLLDLRTRKFLKTKSLMAALGDLLNWLEKVSGQGPNSGIILVYHEMRKASPGILLEGLKRYNLLDRFQAVVKGFANGANVAVGRCPKTVKSYSLWSMVKNVLHADENLSMDGAVIRAEMTYNAVRKLVTEEGATEAAVSVICQYTNTIEVELEEIAQLKVLLERQNTFRPVFGALLRGTRIERQQASHLRRLLAENNISFERVKEAYGTKARDGLCAILKDEVRNVKDVDFEALLNILDCYFDPDKKAVQPRPRFFAGTQAKNGNDIGGGKTTRSGLRRNNRNRPERVANNLPTTTVDDAKCDVVVKEEPTECEEPTKICADPIKIELSTVTVQ